ncbi:MAG: zinc dependent phospholipase C family protein [Gallionella sp.]
MNRLTHIIWLLPLLLYSSDALAWGLYTHVYFAQQLVWAIPLADSRFRRAVSALPAWVMAGACLPDLAVTGRTAGTRDFKQTHQWDTARTLLAQAGSDEERALALGFASHLLVDVIAHNYFVPAHEKLWVNIPTLTHASSEWAMDAHIKAHVFNSPASLLKQNGNALAQYAAANFHCNLIKARRAIVLLAHGDAILRGSRLGEGLYHSGKLLDRNLKRRFNYYLRETSRRLVQINQVLEGRDPVWHPEPSLPHEAHDRVRSHTPSQINYRLPIPQDLFLSEA